MPVTTSNYTITDTNGNPLYSAAEGNTGSTANPGVPRSAPFHYDCDTARQATNASADLQAAVSGKSLRVHAIVLSADSACDLTIQSGGSTDVYGPIYLGANDTHELALDTGIFQSAEGEKLNVVLSGSANYSAFIRYREIS